MQCSARIGFIGIQITIYLKISKSLPRNCQLAFALQCVSQIWGQPCLLMHWRPQGRARGALAPPPPGRPKIVFFVLFLDFLAKNSIFFVVFFGKKQVLAPPPLKIFALPWKKVCGRPCAYGCSIVVMSQFSKLPKLLLKIKIKSIY